MSSVSVYVSGQSGGTTSVEKVIAFESRQGNCPNPNCRMPLQIIAGRLVRCPNPDCHAQFRLLKCSSHKHPIYECGIDPLHNVRVAENISFTTQVLGVKPVELVTWNGFREKVDWNLKEIWRSHH